MKLMRFLLQRARGLALVAILAGLIAGIANSVILALINTALSRGRPAAATLLSAFAGLCLIMLVSRVVSEVLLLRIAQDAVFELRLGLSRRILAAPLRHLEELGAHRLLATLTDDVPVIAGSLSNLPVLCMQLAIVVGILVYLGWLSVPLLLWVLGIMLVGTVTYQLPMKRGLLKLRLEREHWDSLYRGFRALSEGAKELKLHHQRREGFFSKVLKPSAQSVRDYNVSGMSMVIAASSWGHLLFFILIGLLIFALPNLNEISTQTLTGYTITILYMMTPLQVVLGLFPEMGRANIAMNKVEELGLSLAARSVEKPLGGAPVKEASWRQLELSGVTHAYYVERENSSFTLGPIDLSLRPGELRFIVGGNGSGKTTLAKLLTGLYTPEAGEIRFDGVPVTNENRESYRQNFSVVFSDFFLFESLLGLETPKLDAQAGDYLKQLQLDHKVQIKDGALSTTELSQGQRKRLALLTAYLEDRPIYLFDEWAADQDPLFKDIFYLQLLPELKARGKTVLVISHDDRYYYLADHITKLNYGKIEYDKPVIKTDFAEAEVPLGR
jgi:putative ATP-binding cassette transporter